MSLRSRLVRLAHVRPELRPHLLPMLREASSHPSSLGGEVLRLLDGAEVGAGAELEAFADRLRGLGGGALGADDVEAAVAAAESRLEDAEYELRTDRIPEHRAGNRAERDHYRRVLEAVRRLRPTRTAGARRFGATLSVRAEVEARGHEVVGDEVRFEGVARLRLLSPTGGVVAELGGIRYAARYSVVGDFFSVRAENDLYAEAVTEACIANRDGIVGELARDGLLGR